MRSNWHGFLSVLGVFALAIGVALLVEGCQTMCTPPGSGVGAPTGTAPTTQPTPQSPASALAWEVNHAERAAWSAELRKQALSQLEGFSQAEDWSSWCPTWGKLADADKAEVVSTMAVEIARWESGFQAASVYHEPPPLSVDSIGLFQLSYEDRMSWCSMSSAKSNLVDAIVNIQCAIPEMSHLMARDRVVAGGDKGVNAKGLSRYWQVIRDGDHKAQIMEKVKALALCAAHP